MEITNIVVTVAVLCTTEKTVSASHLVWNDCFQNKYKPEVKKNKKKYTCQIYSKLATYIVATFKTQRLEYRHGF